MSRILSLLLLLTLFISCEKNENYTIEGTLENVEDGTAIYLQEIDENNRLANVDTTQVLAGKFNFTPENVASPNINIITVDKINNGRLIFIAENQKIKITLNKDSLYISKVRGGAENDFFKTYYDEVVDVNKEKQRLQTDGMNAMRNGDTEQVEVIKNELKQIDEIARDKRIELIQAHPESHVSVIILTDLIGLKQIKADKAEALFESLDSQVKETEKGKKLSEMIAKFKSTEIASTLVEVGNKAPNFSAPQPDGTVLALNSALGKYTIIDFWASWCKPCRVENPNVVAAYEKFHDKGLNILSVSLDKPNDKEKWVKAIKDDNMNWNHVSNLQYWQDPIAKQFGVRAIPATFLLDENGVIIEKDLRGKDLQDKLESLLGV